MPRLTAIISAILLCTLLLAVTSCTESRRDIDLETTAPLTAGKAKGDFLSVDDLLKDREQYLGRIVEVSGVVETGLAFEFVSEQPYLLKGSTEKLWVITREMAPKEESFVTVRGKLVSPYQIKGRKYDLVLVEEGRS